MKLPHNFAAIVSRGFGGIGGFDEKDDPFLDDIFSGSNGT